MSGSPGWTFPSAETLTEWFASKRTASAPATSPFSGKTGLPRALRKMPSSREGSGYAARTTVRPRVSSGMIEQPDVWTSGLGWSGIRGVPVDVDAVRGCPVLVDLDEDGGGEAEQGSAVGEDANLAGAAFDLLLDGPLDGVGGTHAPPVRLRQGEDGEAFGDVVLEPVGEAVGRATVGGDQTIEFFLRGLQRGGVPDPAQLGADPLADGGVGGVVNGVLREVELAALPDGTGQDGAAGGLQPGMVVTDDEADAAEPRSIRLSRKARQWTSASDGSQETPSTRRRPSGPTPMAENRAASRTTPPSRSFS